MKNSIINLSEIDIIEIRSISGPNFSFFVAVILYLLSLLIFNHVAVIAYPVAVIRYHVAVI